MAEVLKGKPVVDAMARDLELRVARLREQNVKPTLAIVRVGQRPDDLSYERTALKRAESLGIDVRSVVLDETTCTEQLAEAIEAINKDVTIHGCLLFRPLPPFIDENAICDLLVPEKDIDGITRASLASVFVGQGVGYAPATAAAVMRMLDYYEVPLNGAHVVVVGRSLVIGKPVAQLLLARHATVTTCHSRTADLPELMRAADVVVCATGRARGYGEECFSAGQVVIDVGINFDDEGNLCGDVDFDAVEPVVGAITPVPGGIGSVTTSTTMAHVVEAAERAAGLW